MTVGVLEFIGKITQHILPKGFRIVRKYGVYSRNKNKIAKEIMHLYNFMKQETIKALIDYKKKHSQKKKNWKERIIESFGRNPLSVKDVGLKKYCGKYGIRIMGVIYDIRETSKEEDISYEPKLERTQIHRKVIQVSLL